MIEFNQIIFDGFIKCIHRRCERKCFSKALFNPIIFKDFAMQQTLCFMQYNRDKKILKFFLKELSYAHTTLSLFTASLLS